MSSNATVFNVPNQLTGLRFLLSIVMFVLIPYGLYRTALIVFLIAVTTDWLDGYWARKYDQVTQLGRILDPFVDKIIICGAFIFLVSHTDSGIAAWMAVIVVGRELLVTAIRAHLEQQGTDFSAQFSGKLKMIFQCAAVALSLIVLSRTTESQSSWLVATRDICVWLAVLSTIYSGTEYVVRAVRLQSG